MIRQLYELEDWLFYRSRSLDPALRRIIENSSCLVGHFADRLNAIAWRSRAT